MILENKQSVTTINPMLKPKQKAYRKTAQFDQKCAIMECLCPIFENIERLCSISAQKRTKCA